MCARFPTFANVSGLDCVSGVRVDSEKRAKKASDIYAMCSNRLSVEA